MLLTNVSTKTVRDRTPLALYVGLGITAFSFIFLIYAASLEEEMANLTKDLPEAFTSIMGGVESNYAIAELFGLMAPIAVLVIAISGGINVLASEERNRTADLLLTLPLTRREVVISKATVLVFNVALVCGSLLVGTWIGASLISIKGFEPSDAVAINIHLFFLGLAFGMIALAASNATGSTAVGTGFAAGLAVLSNLVSGLLPLVEGYAGWAKISPWYYYNGSDPLTNGIKPSHLAVLAAIAGGCFVVSLLVIDHRDIGSQSAGSRLKIPAIGMITRPKVGSVFAKALSERLTMITVVSGILVLMGLMISAMYNGIKGSLVDFADAFPESVLALFGASDFSTPEGWIQIEMQSLTVPLALLAVTITMGTKAIAGNDADRTLALLAATPIKRSRIVIDNALAILGATAIVSIICWLGLVAGSALAGLGIESSKLAASMTHIALLTLFFGYLALAIGAATSSGTAVKVSITAVVVAYFGDWLLSLREGLAPFAVLSPWHYASAAEPLIDGVNFAHLGVLAGLSVIAVAAAVYFFERRELLA